MYGIRAEKRLALLYSLCVIFTIISTICIAVPWQYWRRTLDICIDIDCGCILYGHNTPTIFMGGDVKICQFVTFGLIPVCFFGLCFGIYHGYRSFIHRKLSEPKITTLTTHNRKGNSIDRDVVVVLPKRQVQYKHWITPTFLAALISCLSLAHVIFITDGYYKTCEQYRKHAISLLRSSSNEAKVIHDRLSCTAIFDFMDYIQPDKDNYQRGDEINTGLSLQFSIITTWFNLFTWLCIFSQNLYMVRRTLKQKDEQFCCC